MKKIMILLEISVLCAMTASCMATAPEARADLSSFAVPPQMVGGEEVVRELRMTFGLGPSDSEDAGPGVGEMPERRILAQFPAVLAVARVGTESVERNWYMSSPDPETTDMIEEALKGLDAIRRIEPLLSFGGGTPSLTYLRRSAAALGADILFVYTTQTIGEDYFNPAAWGYLSGVGLFIIPGNSIKVTSAAQGLLIDVKSGFPLGVVTEKTEKKGVAAAGLNLDSRLSAIRLEATRECERAMSDKLARKLTSIIAQMK